jgi:hypothetical protein
MGLFDVFKNTKNTAITSDYKLEKISYTQNRDYVKEAMLNKPKESEISDNYV